MSHRLFFAFFPDPATRRKIENLQRRLSHECGIRGRVVKASQYHVTLAFLGNQPSERLPRLLAIGGHLDMPACSVACDCLGTFCRAGVLWFGTSNPPPELRAFQEQLCAALQQAEIAFDHKPWKFHLTLYRDLRTPCVSIRPEVVNWAPDGFSLVESISTEKGVEYRQLGHWNAGLSGDVKHSM